MRLKKIDKLLRDYPNMTDDEKEKAKRAILNSKKSREIAACGAFALGNYALAFELFNKEKIK